MYRMRKQKKNRKFSLAKLFIMAALLGAFIGGCVYGTPGASAAGLSTSNQIIGQAFQTGGLHKTQFQCGSGANAVYTSIDIGCKGKNCHSNKPGGCSALTDMVFAIIRALSIGVGLVIVASMIFAGIQYTASRDDPSAVGKAKERVLNNVIALLVYIFSYAIINYLIPNGFFQ